jgi:hypothetical protein
MFKALEGELPNYITNNIISYINIEPNYVVRNPRFFYEHWTNIKIMEIIFNCIPTGTLGAVGQMRLKQVVI